MLTRFGSRIVLAFDADAAGENAAARFYAWEQKYDVDVRVAALPPGQDPGDLAQSDPDALRTAVEESRPFLALPLRPCPRRPGPELARGQGPRRRPGAGRHRRAHQRAGPGPVPHGAGRPAAAGPRPSARSPEGRPRAAVDEVVERVEAPSQASGRELEALRLLVHHRDEIVERLDAVLFADPVAQGAYAVLVETGSVQDAVVVAEGQVRHLLYRLAQEEAGEGPDRGRRRRLAGQGLAGPPQGRGAPDRGLRAVARAERAVGSDPGARRRRDRRRQGVGTPAHPRSWKP